MIRSLLFATALAATPALGEGCIDTELTFLADVSHSMNGEPKRIQRAGYAAAFRNGFVLDQIAAGACGAIAVQYVEFANYQEIVADWSVIVTDEDAEAFAQAIEAAPKAEVGELTDIAAAMEFAAMQIAANGLDANWRVVDVSSDGMATRGESPSIIREKYTQGPIWEQVTFNGLPITRSGSMNDDLKAYFENHIVGGPRSFLEDPVSLEGLGDAIIRKLQEEIG